jgi:hypothetical protein
METGNLNRLIQEYYRTEETDRMTRARLTNSITREVKILIKQKNTVENIKEFINTTQNDILRGLGRDHYMNRYTYNTNIYFPVQVPVRPLVAAKTPAEEVEQLLHEANLGFNMISEDIGNNNIVAARAILEEIAKIPNSPFLIGFNGELRHIQDLIRGSRQMIDNAEARAPAIGARGFAAAAAAREPVIPQAAVVNPVDILPEGIIIELLDSKNLEQYKEMMECPICNINIRNIRIVPCGHTLCKECAEKIIETTGKKRCPICNSNREGFKKAFYAKYLKYKMKYLKLKKQN